MPMAPTNWFYRGGHPNRVAHRLNRIGAALSSLGVAPNGSLELCRGVLSSAVVSMGEEERDGRQRGGVQVYRCHGCRRRFTALSATPFSGYRFPPDVIALAVRWYLRLNGVQSSSGTATWLMLLRGRIRG